MSETNGKPDPGVCGNCRFWNNVGHDEENSSVDMGECRRRGPPPVMAQVPDLLREFCSVPGKPETFDPEEATACLQVHVWPHTYEYDWCGDYERPRNA